MFILSRRIARSRDAVVPMALIALALAPRADAQDSAHVRRDTTKLAVVTVIGSTSDLAQTRTAMRAVPGSVAMIQASELRSTRQANLADVLKFTPGVFVQSRYGAADESQLSIRGSGLRNNFHARGVNLLVNGMPYRNADGFTDYESLELLTTEAMEVYKGANALRYGGSTLGGAINLDTRTGYTAPALSAFAQRGASGFAKGQLSSGGTRGDLDWYASFARTQLDGYRDWSDQKRDRLNLHAGRKLSSSTDVRAFYFFAHVREHLPGALTRAELQTAPTQAVGTNVTNRWGRDYDLHHVGVQYRAQLSPNQRVEVSPYLQYRDIDHPIFEVISQISHDLGVEMRYENTADVGGKRNRFTVGLQPAAGTTINKQYVNSGGTHGAVTRDELDRASTIALYAEDGFSFAPRLTAIAGMRLERSGRRVTDRFLANGDQSDDRTFDALAPRVGLLATLPSNAQLYANVSRTVEPPLLLELSSFGNSGGFIPLDAQSAWQYELGTRFSSLGLKWDVAAYDIELTNELLNVNVKPFPTATFTVPSYRNAPATRHRGLEAGVGFQKWVGLLARGDVRDAIGGRIAYTYNHFTYVDDPQFRGHRLPGAPSQFVSAELSYQHPSGLTITPSIEAVPGSYFLDSNNSVTNTAWSSIALRAEWTSERLGTTVFVQGQNLANRRYSGSTQVDNAAGRYFEPSDPRSFYAGLRWNR